MYVRPDDVRSSCEMKQATPVASTYRINVKATSDERFFKVLIVMIVIGDICLFQQFESVEKINYIMPYDIV